MHDIKAIRADPAGFDAAMERRGFQTAAETVLKQDQLWRSVVTAVEQHQAARNEISQRVGVMRRAGEDTSELQAGATRLAALMQELSEENTRLLRARDDQLSSLPNLLDPDVPDGHDETANVVLHQHGEPARFDFAPQQHFEIGEALGLMDFAAAAKLSGARFTVLRGPLARLERALGQWMLDRHTGENGYTEVSPPLLVNEAAAYGTGQLPKFADDLFRTTDGRFLIPTSEVPLTNLVAGDILAHDALPIRVAALTPCFRSEAGSAGRDTRGMLRQHQFQKVELVSVTRAEDSAEEHERMTRCAEGVLSDLGLTWRRVLLCAGDTGFSAAKTYDLEVWLPGQGAWREISSCSNTRDFQARRMDARYRPREGKGTAFVHTLNGSGVAVGRALIAVLETHQAADGSVLVPEPLRPYMGGTGRIARGGARA